MAKLLKRFDFQGMNGWDGMGNIEHLHQDFTIVRIKALACLYVMLALVEPEVSVWIFEFSQAC